MNWKVTLRKDRATWTYFTRNPVGGGFGSNYCGPQHIAMARAIKCIPNGAIVELEVNSKRRPDFIRQAFIPKYSTVTVGA